jgi:hypothetical protein
MAASAAQSMHAFGMELIGAVTARDNLAAEVKDLRGQLDAAHERNATSVSTTVQLTTGPRTARML